jgi:glycosyltransferase involved in cell wall biosynthesis
MCLPRSDQLGGGTSSFFRNLRTYLETTGTPFTDRLDDGFDVLFANSWVVRYRAVLHAKQTHPNVKILHRVDGSAIDYGREPFADVRQAYVNCLADLTVFQSQYGKYATTRKYRVIGQDGPVIHNPVDIERFQPMGERVPLPGKIRVCSVSQSTNPRKGGPLLYRLARANPRVQFILVGFYEEIPRLSNIHFLGYTDWNMLPSVLRSSDVFLMLAENEACPNVVLEAMASGLPILYRKSGGTPELVGECGCVVEMETFDDSLCWALDHRRALGEASRRRAVEQFSPGVVFPRYFEAIEATPRRPLPTAWDSAQILRLGGPVLFALVRWVLARAAGQGSRHIRTLLP